MTYKKRITYVGRRYISGISDAVLNLYDPDGTQVVTNGSMTELGSTGVYYYDYTATKVGTYVGYMDSASQPNKQPVEFDIMSVDASSASSGTLYCTTLELLEFLGLVSEIPAFVEGSDSSNESIGTGDDSTTTFYLDHNNVIDGSYVFYHGTTALTETTHYTLDKDAGKLVLTAAGVTEVSTDAITGSYKYSVLSDSVVSDFIERASRQIDAITNTTFYSVTNTDEYHDGKGAFENTYFTRKSPIIAVSSLSTTQNDDETAAASTTWDSLTENDHFYVDTGTGRIVVTYSSYRPVRGINRLKLTYTSGHSTVPLDVEQACVRFAAQILIESTMAGGMVNAKIDADTLKFRSTMGDIKKGLMKYYRRPIEYN